MTIAKTRATDYDKVLAYRYMQMCERNRRPICTNHAMDAVQNALEIYFHIGHDSAMMEDYMGNLTITPLNKQLMELIVHTQICDYCGEQFLPSEFRPVHEATNEFLDHIARCELVHRAVENYRGKDKPND